MAVPLTVSEIANMIGVEEAIIRQTLERRDEDLAPYLHDPILREKKQMPTFHPPNLKRCF